MRAKKLLVYLLTAGAALSAAPVVTGCAGEAYIVETSPPPPRAEVSVYRPGYVWIQGRWERSDGHWYWREGHYARERPGYVYLDGRWERRGRSYIWVEGRWQPRARVTIEGRL